MAFRNLMAKLGAGNATVDTVLDSPVTQPGGTVTGTVHLTGGSVAQDIAECRVSLQAAVEVESGDHEWRENVTFGTAVVAGAGRIEPGARAAVPFSFPVPWQCPFTAVDGWTLTFPTGGDQRVSSAWNATVTQTGSDVTLTAAHWNSRIASGAGVTAGILGRWDTSDAAPPSFSLNGAPCDRD